ncbi:MAG: type III PLP-dependent enzyme [Pseudomonadota bacterium]
MAQSPCIRDIVPLPIELFQMSLLSPSATVRPSTLFADDCDHHLSVFESVAHAVAGHTQDDAFAVLFPRRIAASAKCFLSGFPGTVLYAVKANPHPAVLQTVWASGVRCFDVASIREIDLVQRVCGGARLFLMHPVKSRATIRHAYRSGIRDFAFDTLAELEKIITETEQATDLSLHLRLSLPDTGGAVMPLTEKFGAFGEDAIDLLRRASPWIARLGVAFHVGSQCLDPSTYNAALAYVADIVAASRVTIDSVDCGGGFPVAYPGMSPVPMAEYFESIRRALKQYGFDGIDVFGEPGRAISALGGSTIARVELRRGSDLYLNDGTYGSLFDAGQFAWRFPVARIGGQTEPSEAKVAYRFFGPTCDSLDRMVGPFHLPADMAEGDWIEIGHTGAYAQTLSTNFNGFGVRETYAVMAP